MADRYLLESGSPDGYQLEDGSGVLLLDAVTASSTLTDNFDDNSQDTSKWQIGALKTKGTTSGVTVSETGSLLQITPGSSTNYSGYLSTGNFDLTNDAVYVKFTISGSSAGTDEGYLAAGQDGDNCYVIDVATASGSPLILFQRCSGGVETQVGAAIAYSATTHAWLRLRYDGTTVYLDTATASASDPPVSGDWTNRLSETKDAAVSLSAAKIALVGGSYAGGSGLAVFNFDGFNTATTGVASSTGTGAATESTDTTAASGTASIAAIGAITETADAGTGSGALSITGSGASTESADTSSASGAVAISATGASTEGADTTAAAGTVATHATGASTETTDTTAGAGTLSVSGTGTPTESADTGGGAGAVSVSASGASTEGNDTASAAGAVSVAGSGASVEANDTSSATGAAVIAASGAATEGTDNGAGSGTVAQTGSTGTGASTEGSDTTSASGTVGVSATGASVEAPDTTSGAGALTIAGTGAANDNATIASGAGAVLITGSGAANDNAATGNGSGTAAVNFQPDSAPLGRIGHVGARLRSGMAARAARIGQVIRRR